MKSLCGLSPLQAEGRAQCVQEPARADPASVASRARLVLWHCPLASGAFAELWSLVGTCPTPPGRDHCSSFFRTQGACPHPSLSPSQCPWGRSMLLSGGHFAVVGLCLILCVESDSSDRKPAPRGRGLCLSCSRGSRTQKRCPVHVSGMIGNA